MNEIYFTNKGHTNKLNISNIWPTRETARVRPEFFQGKKLVLLIDPVMVDKTYYTATFRVYDAERITYYEMSDGTKVMSSHCFMHAELNKGDLFITTRNTAISDFLSASPVEKNRFWAYRDEALQLLRQGVEEFDSLFPIQSHKK